MKFKFINFITLFFVTFLQTFTFMPKASASEKKTFHFALGAGLAIYNFQDYGEADFTQLAPEFVTYGYLPLIHNLWFRPAIRLNYSWEQPDLPTSLKIEENDFRYMAETGFVYDGVVVPSLSVAMGKISRKIQFKTKSPIILPQDYISRNESLNFVQTQLGLGIPIHGGFVLIEPYIRTIKVQLDNRYNWGYGIETTVQLF